MVTDHLQNHVSKSNARRTLEPARNRTPGLSVRQEPWSGVDDILIARYLADNCDEHDREVVEQAAESSPEVRA